MTSKMKGILKSFFLLTLLVPFQGTAVKGSGIWIDNGSGLTVKADLSPEETAVITKDMLTVLGLPEPPKHHKKHHWHIEASGAMWLREVYENLDDKGRPSGKHLDEHFKRTVAAADTVITFINRDPPDAVEPQDANKRLWFDMNTVSLDHSLLGAELHIYREPIPDAETLLLHVYIVLDKYGTEKEVLTTEFKAEGWKSVNVTAAAFSWIIFPENNCGLRLALSHPWKKKHVSFRDGAVTGAHDNVNFRPFLVGFFAIPLVQQQQKHSRRIRSVSGGRSPVNSYLKTMKDYKPPDVLCQKQHLYVSFSNIGWGEWVVAPSGYSANYCAGRCEFPLQHTNANNHAIVQTLVRLTNATTNEDDLPPYPGCAPIDLATMSVLYFDKHNNLILKKFPDMIVKKCGCL